MRASVLPQSEASWTKEGSVAGSREPREISSKAWEWFKDAEAAYRRASGGSEQELQAIQAMSLAAIAGMLADQQDSWR